MHKNESSLSTQKQRFSKPTVSVVGARGYSGLEVVRILLNHPEVDLKFCFATEAFSLKNYFSNSKINSVQCLAQTEIFNHPTDIVFLATPAEVSMNLAPQLIEKNKSLVIDISGAFRLKKNSYENWYGFDHENSNLLSNAIYGLNPWFSATEKKKDFSQVISNPGCYATSVLMALVPLLKDQLIHADSIVVDAKSGTTGGGKKPSENLLYSEVEGECLPYKIGKHQHYPEIKEYLQKFSGVDVDFHFSTSLLPTRRGIISSLFCKLNDNIQESHIEACFQKYYGDYSMVRFGTLKNNPQLVSLKKVVGTNFTFISYTVDNGKLYLFSVIDNLIKGAAGQAVENMNKHFDYPVDLGLSTLEALQ